MLEDFHEIYSDLYGKLVHGGLMHGENVHGSKNLLSRKKKEKLYKSDTTFISQEEGINTTKVIVL